MCLNQTGMNVGADLNMFKLGGDDRKSYTDLNMFE